MKPIVGGSCHEYHFSHNKTLSQQTCVCCDKCVFGHNQNMLVGKKKNCNKIMYVATNTLSQQIFVATQFVVTKVLS